MHRVIQDRVGAHAPLETTRPAINLAQQLNWEPALVTLYGIGWRERPGQLGNANEVDSCNEVNESLGNAHERTDLADRL